ncbi:C-type lectin domain family 4 member A-like [Phodopus roborovskii]|uniref:C-type lectin domain family 4 member A-like n=1 Tax=Phodopus roborovskii TaxID=109678 RepID=UPI0021E48831|nr:C-type lectin domain family 4 member A-like [Phodopus roborovskii]
MASEIMYAEVKFKNESNSPGTDSNSAAAPEVKPTPHLSKPAGPTLLFTSLMALFLLLAISFLVAFIFYFQKYSQLLEENNALRGLNYTELSCTKDHSLKKDKFWSCCPKDWKPFSSHCYFIPTASANWSESEEKCFSMGAHLMVVHSKEEQDFITKILNVHDAYFIGLSDPGHRQWRWVDQTPYNGIATFWHPGEPNNDKEQCVIVNHPRSSWGWNDSPCSVKQKSVCQRKKIYV